MTISLFPSFELAKDVRIEAPKELPFQVNAGYPILLPMESDLVQINIGSLAFSPLYEQGFWFAVAGLYQKGDLLVTGVKKPRKPPRLKFWQRTEVPYFVHKIAVNRKPLSQAQALRLPAQVVQSLDAQSEEVKKRQAQQVRAIFDAPQASLSFSCPERPTRSVITSQFGSPRTLPSGKSYYHSGLDLRAAVGSRVRSVSRGIVRFAGEMVLPGQNVIVDHGEGIFSRYMHLSEILVREGMWIEKGDLIGLAGASGRVEAPHLHWEMIWKGEHADPLALLESWQPLCDFTQKI